MTDKGENKGGGEGGAAGTVIASVFGVILVVLVVGSVIGLRRRHTFGGKPSGQIDDPKPIAPDTEAQTPGAVLNTRKDSTLATVYKSRGSPSP